MSAIELLKNMDVVLVGPRFPENIGAAARAVANMGLGGLRLVAPMRLWDEPIKRLATDQGMPVIQAMQVFDTLDEALADCTSALATTARQGDKRGRLLPPRQAAPRALELAAEGRTALIFGPEDRGLNTQELDRAFFSVCIPTSEESSLNLAQAVVVLAYEMRQAAIAAQGKGLPNRRKPASMEEMQGLREHLTRAFTAINMLRKDNPEHFFRPFKNVLDRARPSSAEVRALRGMARQILWLSKRMPED